MGFLNETSMKSEERRGADSPKGEIWGNEKLSRNSVIKKVKGSKRKTC